MSTVPKQQTLLEALAMTINNMEIQPPLSDWQMILEQEYRRDGTARDSMALLLSCRVSGVSQVDNVEDLPKRIERKIEGLDIASTEPRGAEALKRKIESLARSMRTELGVYRGHIDLAGQPIEKELELKNDPNAPGFSETRPSLRRG